MKTEALIEMLARGSIAADTRAPERRLGAAAAIALTVVVLAMLATLGARPDLASASALPMFWLKLAFPAALAVPAFVATSRLARPGDSARGSWVAIGAIVASIWAFAGASLASAAAGQRLALIAGSSAQPCMISIALLALPLFVASFWTLRAQASTQPRIAGAAAGLLSGALAAVVYAVHCTEMEPAFLAVWYELGILIPAVLGAIVGPRLLRWI